jgi:phosphate transport system substrate-binding protein
VDKQVAVVVFVLVINSNVAGVSGLGTDQIRAIYSGGFTNWSQVGGQNLDIVRISRPATSGTRASFEKYILGGIETVSGPQSLVRDTNEAVAQNVEKTKGAIGYVSLYYAKQHKLKILSIDDYAPTIDGYTQNLALVNKSTYGFWNIEHMYIKNEFAVDLVNSFTKTDN